MKDKAIVIWTEAGSDHTLNVLFGICPVCGRHIGEKNMSLHLQEVHNARKRRMQMEVDMEIEVFELTERVGK